MQVLTTVLIVSQILFTAIAGIYFFESLKNQSSGKNSVKIDSKSETEHLKKLRSVSLTRPLSEKTRPEKIEDVLGQESGIKALRAALCSANPQHVIIYGPPGVGKTAAARLILEEAKKNIDSPFKSFSKFVEIDATTLRFDERSIADPLIGSVHDPIYQGAGAYGAAGVPQPKEGAVTKAHGGVLFIDEIGELHSVQMNKLLKVLEDRKVSFSSSYYNSENENIPVYIHDIFKNGMPADFRLIGATTRTPNQMPPALRSRCTEIFFHQLKKEHIIEISSKSFEKAGFISSNEVCEKIASYAENGRDAVNIVQMSASVASLDSRNTVMVKDVEWVIQSGHYAPVIGKKVGNGNIIGTVNGLAVYGSDCGMLLEIETVVKKIYKGKGTFKITGIVEEEEIKGKTSSSKRVSCARASVMNVVTFFQLYTGIDLDEYNVHINFPGGMPVDGPSAGVAIFCSLHSAIYKRPISEKIAVTGEISLRGKVLPVGGVTEKILAAVESGVEMVIIPKSNWQEAYKDMDINVCVAEDIYEVLRLMKTENPIDLKNMQNQPNTSSSVDIISAEGI